MGGVSVNSALICECNWLSKKSFQIPMGSNSNFYFSCLCFDLKFKTKSLHPITIEFHDFQVP